MLSKNIICCDIDESFSEVFEAGTYKIGYFIARALGKEKPNEDSLFIFSDDNRIFFGVSDGAGGHPKGAEASRSVCESLKKDYSKKSYLDMIFNANEKVKAMKVGAKCTLCMGVVTEHYLQAFSVGDSEFISWNHLGTELYSNIPDSKTGYSIEAGHLTQEEALDDPERYVVNNMMGDTTIRVEATSPISTKKGQTYLVGSDGLFDNFSHRELYELIGQGSFEENFQKLVELCGKQEDLKKNDDISFIVVKKIKA